MPKLSLSTIGRNIPYYLNRYLGTNIGNMQAGSILQPTIDETFFTKQKIDWRDVIDITASGNHQIGIYLSNHNHFLTNAEPDTFIDLKAISFIVTDAAKATMNSCYIYNATDNGEKMWLFHDASLDHFIMHGCDYRLYYPRNWQYKSTDQYYLILNVTRVQDTTVEVCSIGYKYGKGTEII